MAQITTEEALRAVVGAPHPMTKLKILDHLDAQGLDFVSRAPFLLLATTNADGSLEVSPKGDEPGFVQALDARTLLLPDRPGNNLAFGLTNVLARPDIGLIFLTPATGETLRVSGRATLHDDADLCERLAARGQPAKLVIRVAVQRAYFHCARSILRAKLWEPQSWDAPHKVSFGRIIREQAALAPVVPQALV
jgi:PPOX class probable FMN-dependent enzyme